MQTKVCTKCGESKGLEEYYKEKRAKSGLCTQCKACIKECKQAHKEKRLARQKEYYQENKEKIAARQKKYRQANKENIAAQMKEYYQENKEKIAARAKKYAQENPDKFRASINKRRAHKAGNGGSFTAKEWKALCKKYDNKCLCCGKKKKLHADHVIPVSWEGGHSNISNIQPLCRSCNASKGNHHATDYRINYTVAKAERSNDDCEARTSQNNRRKNIYREVPL